MKKYPKFFAIMVLILSLVSCGNKQDQMAQGGGQPQATPVATVKVPTDSLVTFKRYSARIEGIVNSEARPKISGYITDVLVDEGQKVKQGQILRSEERRVGKEGRSKR